MKKMPVLMLLLTCSATLLFACTKKETPQGDYLAKVGNEKILESSVQKEYDALPDYARQIFDEPEGTRRLLEEIIKKELLYLEAKKKGYERNKDFQERMEEFRKLTLISEIFDKEIMAKAVVTDEDARKFFDENKDKFIRKNQVHARHILVNTREEAETALGRLKKGEKFEKIAGEMSVDKATAKNGGDLGFFSRGEMVPAFENVAFTLSAGEVSNPVKTPFGFHIIQVLEIKEGSPVEFDGVKDMILQKLSSDRQRKVFEDYIEDLKKQYKININDEALARFQKKIAKSSDAGAAEGGLPAEEKSGSGAGAKNQENKSGK